MYSCIIHIDYITNRGIRKKTLMKKTMQLVFPFSVENYVNQQTGIRNRIVIICSIAV